MELSKKASINFDFKASHITSILAAGGVLCFLVGKTQLGIGLIGLAALLHYEWLHSGRRRW
jgi:hypothetical protein